MAKLQLLAGSTSKLIDVFIQDTSVTTGAGLTGLTNGSGSLTWYYYREGAASAVQVTAIASMTLGTWTSKGFIVVDGTNMPGVYQLGVPDAALAAGAKSVVMMLKGATNMAPVLIEIELTAVDNQNATNFGLTDLDAAISSRMATYTQPTGFLAATFPAAVASTTNITAGTISTVTTLTNLPSIPANWLTATGIAASALNGKGDWNIGKTGYSITGTITTLDALATHGDSTWATATGFATPTNITAGTITTVTNLTNAPTTGDFTTTMKTSLNAATLSTVATVGSVTGSVGSVVGLTASNLDATISSRMATYVQPTGFLAATFPSGTIANTTNITAGAITTVTNLTNAPTAGDFTTTMKASLNAATISTVATVGSVTGSVGSVVGLTASNLDATVSSRLPTSSYTAPDNSGIAAIEAKTNNLPADPAGVSDIPTANQNANALLDQANGIETGLTPRQAMRLSSAADAGKLSGAATTTNTIRNAVADSKDRIVATVDSSGNRTAITYDLT